MAEEQMMTSIEVEVALEARLAGAPREVEPYRLGSFSIDVPLRLGLDGEGRWPRPKNAVGGIVITPDQVGMLERLADALHEAARTTRKRAAEVASWRAAEEAEEAGRD